ncbi:MAG: tRNA lysidine(34) synthetase TilS, partial [Dehalococcoidales bacterium]|nr:tRNA lysidine(34) synthetase TilS [Dehalococcoidales bacterium]
MTELNLSIEDRVDRFIREKIMVSTGSCLLLAVSGGADSTCLLHLMVYLKERLGIRLHVAHLDHQLRGEESVADAVYVIELAHRLGVPVTVSKADVKGYQKKHRLSMEEAAREVRYTFLAETAGAVGAEAIATGHTLDDRVETILLHIIRGTGIHGLTGLKPKSRRRLNGKTVDIIRPILEISRSETEEYCRKNNLVPRLDSTNLSLPPLRNRVRRKLIPLLKSYNPGVVE